MSDAIAGVPQGDVVGADLERDREAILALWRSGLGHHGDPAGKLAWFYAAHPLGAPTLLMLRAGTEAIGIASIAARRMRYGGAELEAGVLADFVVRPDQRGFFPALALQRRVRELGAANHALLYGLPNPQSEAIVKRVGYRAVGAVTRWAMALRTGTYLARRMPRWLAGGVGAVVDRSRHAVAAARSATGPRLQAHWVDEAVAEMDALWQAAIDPAVLMGVRDRAFLQWRFARHPFLPHRFFVLEQGGRLCAYAACHVRDDSLEVSDFLVDPATPDAAITLWRTLAREAYRDGHTRLTVRFLGPAALQEAMRAAGLSPRDADALYAVAGTLATLPAQWYFTAADNDA